MPRDDDAPTRTSSDARPTRTVVQPRPARTSTSRSDEMAARKRVAALVSGGIHFHVKRDHDRIAGARGHSGAKLWTTLSSKGFHAEQTIDLQSRRAGEFRESIAAALPLLHRRGVKHLRIAFATTELGEDETPELRAQAVIDALTLGAAAPLVRGFASAHETLGGAKVLAVLLI